VATQDGHDMLCRERWLRLSRGRPEWYAGQLAAVSRVVNDKRALPGTAKAVAALAHPPTRRVQTSARGKEGRTECLLLCKTFEKHVADHTSSQTRARGAKQEKASRAISKHSTCIPMQGVGAQ
jgi:hypothetical protein